MTGILDQILMRASRRHFLNAALEYVALAVGAGALGAVALLLVGTQILNWYWPVLLFLGGLVVGAWKLRKRGLSRYAVAQFLDERLELSDRLSTLVWFRDHIPTSAAAVETVESQASNRVQPDDVERAIPVRTPRYALASLAILLTAGGLFGVRYFVLQTMDLSKPIANVDFSSFTPEPKVQAATKKSAIQERFEKQLKDLGIDIDDLPAPDAEALQAFETNVPGAPDPDSPQTGEKGQKVAPSEKSDGSETGEGDEQGEETEGEEASGQQAKEAKGNPPPPNAKPGQQGNNEGLLNKMKDALANLMNKLNKQGNQSEQQQTAMNQQQQQGKQGQQSPQGMQSKSQAQGEGQKGQDQQGDQESGEKASGDKSRAGEKNADKPGSDSSKSGMGQSDGDKSIQEAEQLAAMGKISEILGKRAQQVTGEMTVEVSSGKQQLKTAWTDRKALHSDTGGEVNRDEIPLEYQPYIQRYFEEIRKTAPKAKPGS